MHDINVRCTQERYTYILTHSITSHAYINIQYIIYCIILYTWYIHIYCLIPESESSILWICRQPTLRFSASPHRHHHHHHQVLGLAELGIHPSQAWGHRHHSWLLDLGFVTPRLRVRSRLWRIQCLGGTCGRMRGPSACPRRTSSAEGIRCEEPLPAAARTQQASNNHI